MVPNMGNHLRTPLRLDASKCMVTIRLIEHIKLGLGGARVGVRALQITALAMRSKVG